MDPNGSPAGLSDEELAVMCRDDPDNMDHVSALIKRYMPFIRKKAAQYENIRVSADDLVQEALLAFIKAAEKFDPGRNTVFSAYVSSCVNNRMISVIRKSEAHGGDEQLCDELDSAEDNVTPETIYMERELYSEMSGLLSPRELEIFRRCLAGARYSEIAAELGIGVKAVDNGVQRIRKKLRAALF